MGAESTGEVGRRRSYLRRFMEMHRLKVAEVASVAGVSARSVARVRAERSDSLGGAPGTATLHRIADALEELTHIDSAEVYVELMREAGRGDEVRQADLGLRGAAELARHYQRMSPVARHLLLEQARLLARELPDERDSAGN